MPFITFEGIDKAGKTTHIEFLADRLRQSGYSPLITREPGGTALGERIRAMVLNKDTCPICPMAEMLLIAAARAQHVQEVLRPALERGQVVLCDRYIDSSLVYQGLALKLGRDLVAAVNDTIVEGLWPDLTILLAISPEVSIRRSINIDEVSDRIEGRGLDYFRQVAAGYRLLAEQWPERIQVVDADRPLEAVQEEIVRIVEDYLKRGLGK